MLDAHLIAKTNPASNPNNVIFFRDFRITVLESRLFRVERDAHGRFCDKATQSVWFRNTADQKFTLVEGKSFVKVATDAAALTVYTKFEKSYAELNGKKIPLDNAGNLKGTYRTLDGFSGDYNAEKDLHVPLCDGVCSMTGVAVIDDVRSLILMENGEISARDDDSIDRYIFAFGQDFRAAVKALYAITGHTPMIPRWALGNWWSRYYAYTAKQYLHLLDSFEDQEIPLTVATIDMDWHYSNAVRDEFQFPAEIYADKEKYGIVDSFWAGWTGYSWNRHLFPDYKAFLKRIKEKNYHITLNLHPSDGIRFFEDCYPEMAKAMGKDPETKEQIRFDFTDTSFINNYFSVIHKPMEQDGVGFWWIDWQQGSTSNLAGLDPLWCLNHYHFLDNGLEHEPLILSRFSGVGSHRYPLGFSGDTFMRWDSLQYIPYFTATATNIGFSWWSHDIGGHMYGIRDDELYLRYIQFGVFSPINRLHTTSHEMLHKEPWFYENGIGKIAKDFLILRHRLIPYLYSADYRTHKDGIALIEPMYYEFPDAPNAYRFRSQYLFGGQLMVAPVTTKSEYQGMTPMDAWVPEGRWTDIFTGDIYTGDRVVRMVRPLDSMPVLAREGAVLPLSGDRHTGNSTAIPTLLEVQVFNGNGSFELFEGDAETGAVTAFAASLSDDVQSCAFRFEKSPVIPANRCIKLIFRSIPEGEVRVTADGKEIEAQTDDNESVSAQFSVTGGVDYVVSVRFSPLSELDRLKSHALHTLSRLQGDNILRAQLYDRLMACGGKEEYEDLIRGCHLHSIVEARLLETT